MKILYLNLFLIVLASCSNPKKTSSTVYFSGEIVNPTKDYVYLKKNSIVIDSALLNENNRFSIKLNTIEEGIYHFYHGQEYQYVYLKGNDSILIRLNTIDFDESLVFSGKGEEINNFLLEVFLAEEKEKPLINSYYKLNPEIFRNKLDSLKQLKISSLNELHSDFPLSEKCLKLARTTIDYTYYTFYEKYPFKHRKKIGKKVIQKLPKDFYNYREKLDFSNESLTYYRVYYNFMKNYFGNLSYMHCVGLCGKPKATTKDEFHLNSHKLKLIDSVVKAKDLRDNLLRNVAFEYLLKVHDNEDQVNRFIDVFHKLSGNSKHIKEIDNLHKGLNGLSPNSNLPNVKIQNLEGEIVSLQEVALNNKNTVFYFLSGLQKKRLSIMLRHIANISEEYPEKTFIGISIYTNSANWKSSLQQKNVDATKQFRAINSKKLTHALMVDYLNRSIITKDGLIVDGFADIYTSF